MLQPTLSSPPRSVCRACRGAGLPLLTTLTLPLLAYEFFGFALHQSYQCARRLIRSALPRGGLAYPSLLASPARRLAQPVRAPPDAARATARGVVGQLLYPGD
jgi:hypothetical protein